MIAQQQADKLVLGPSDRLPLASSCRTTSQLARTHRRVRLQKSCQASSQYRWETAIHMEDVYQGLARNIWTKAQQVSPPHKYIVGIAGVPGSGKSSTAFGVAQGINELASAQRGGAAIVVQMDGFHLYRRELDNMPNPAEAYARRGSHWTFAAERFVSAVASLKHKGEASMPSFDHAKGDPVEDDIIVLPDHAVVLIEGLYTLLDEPPWRQVKDLVDESWFVDADTDAALDRVIQRQVQNGSPHDKAYNQVYNNDRLNAYLVEKTRSRADHILPVLPLRG